MITNTLSDTELRRFREQIQFSEIGTEGLLKIRNSRVAIIGAGGTGASALQYLSAMGIGYFGIFDHAMVDELNIQRQSLYGGTDLGKLKTIIAKQRLKDIFPLSQYEIVNLKISYENALSSLESYDIIVDATNNPISSKIIDDACGKLNKPMIFSLISGHHVYASVFRYPVKFSYANTPLIEMEIQPSVSLTHGFAGLFTACETVKLISASPNILSGKLLSFDCLKYISEIKELEFS